MDIRMIIFYVVVALLVITLVPTNVLLVSAVVVYLGVLVQVGIALNVLSKELKKAKGVEPNLKECAEVNRIML